MGAWLLSALHRGVKRALHPHSHPNGRRASSLSKAAAEDDGESEIFLRKFSVASISDPQLHLRIPYGGRFDGSVSIVSRHASRSEANDTSYNMNSMVPLPKYEPTTVSDTAISYPSDTFKHIDFDAKSLLSLSDTIRVCIAQNGQYGPGLETLSAFIEKALAEEKQDAPIIDFQVIKLARLDKLIVEMVDCAKRGTLVSAKSFGHAAAAETLQRLWRARYKANYFILDEIRTIDLATSGRLGGVSFVPPLPWQALDQRNVWKVTEFLNVTPALGNVDYKVGQDGFVETDLEVPTLRPGVLRSVLPLLTGREEFIEDGKLKSPYAPSAGLRYDGLWKISRYSHKLDTDTEIYRLELQLERVRDTPQSLATLLQIPLPSQMDDWRLFEKLEAEKIRQATGEQGAVNWRVQKEEDQHEREQWHRIRDFRKSITSGVGQQPPTSAAAAHKSAMKVVLPVSALQLRPRKSVAAKRAVIDTTRNEEAIGYSGWSSGNSTATPSVGP
ncbi:hypothetical protein B0T17DRAFT_617981 [Bombardia bombarda]|uniref:Uncharacterized protein n=1 Tax=Bombardia bombarda TaxID=252184 RepID=A0AA40C1H4_9PEZI|nr:hypothetical protein B0T17DRAFT_617981 [Bombardia bombarda]